MNVSPVKRPAFHLIASIRLFAVSFILGLPAGWLDRSSRAVQGPLLLLLLAAFAVGFATRGSAWIIGLGTAVGLWIFHLAAGDVSPLMLVPALLATAAAFTGALLSRVLRGAIEAESRRTDVGEPPNDRWDLLVAGLVGIGCLGYLPVYASFEARGQPFGWWLAAIWQVVSFIGWALATPILLKVWARSIGRIQGGTVKPRDVLIHCLVVVALAAAHSIVLMAITSMLFIPTGSTSIALFLWTFAAYLPVDGFGYTLLLALAFAADRDRRVTLEASRVSALAGEVEGARFRALQAQLQPHFLFNALNSAVVLARRGDADVTAGLLLRLADLLRRVLGERRNLVPLADELAFVGEYLEVERLRFPERLRPEIVATPEAAQCLVPPFLLQPLAENAVRHGVERLSTAGVVTVRAWVEDERLRIRVTDDGPGVASGGIEGVGLGATRERLGSLFGDRASMNLSSTPGGGTSCDVVVPRVTG